MSREIARQSELGRAQLDILSVIADHPHYDRGQISEALNMDKGQVSRVIHDLRVKSLLVSANGNGAIRFRQHHYREPETFKWIITGKAKRYIREHRDRLRDRLNRFESAAQNACEYQPPHVVEQWTTPDEEFEKVLNMTEESGA